MLYFINDIKKNKLIYMKDIKDQKAATIAESISFFLEDKNIEIKNLLFVTFDNCPSMRLSSKIIEKIIKNKQQKNFLLKEHNISLYPDIINELNTVNNIKFIGCIIHLIQLILKATFKHTDNLNNYLKKMIEISKFFKKSNFKLQFKYVVLPFEIRWNSVYLFLISFYKNYPKYKEYKKELSQDLIFIFD